MVSIYSPFYNETLLDATKVKKSLLSLPLSYMGYSGYLNPFTLESQINAKMPPISQIITSFHEAAHQLGYANEKEANFIAYLSAIKNNDPYVKYAGYTFAFRYLYYEFYKIDPHGTPTPTDDEQTPGDDSRYTKQRHSGAGNSKGRSDKPSKPKRKGKY